MNIQLVTDSSANLKQMAYNHFASAPLKVIVGNDEFTDDETIDLPGMMHALKYYKGKTSTACPSVDDWLKAFGDADLVLGATITSALSGCYNCARIAAKEYEEANPGKKVFIFDSLSTGPELELLMEKLQELTASGLSFEEMCDALKEYSTHTHLMFSLESLANFARNGRVNPAVAKAVGVLGIRIVGKASDEGTLEPMHKSRGEKNAIQRLFDSMLEAGYHGGKVRIAHTNNLKFANELKALLLARFPNCDLSLRENQGLCAYYTEEGGVLVGYET